MICGNCGRSFTARQGEFACHGCGHFGGCHLVKCPHCGYEQPQEPVWVAKLRDLLARAGIGSRTQQKDAED